VSIYKKPNLVNKILQFGPDLSDLFDLYFIFTGGDNPHDGNPDNDEWRVLKKQILIIKTKIIYTFPFFLGGDLVV